MKQKRDRGDYQRIYQPAYAAELFAAGLCLRCKTPFVGDVYRGRLVVRCQNCRTKRSKNETKKRADSAVFAAMNTPAATRESAIECSERFA